MELAIMLLAPFPLGFLLKCRIAAYVAFIAVHAFVFTFQSLSLVIEWAGGSDAAFGPYPKASSSQVWGYGVVNLAIYLVGFGLVFAGCRAQAWRRNRQTGAVSLEPLR